MPYAVVVAIVFLIVLQRAIWKPTTILEHQRGVLYRNGKFVKLLEPGRYRLYVGTSKTVIVDVRRKSKTIPAQELLSSDGIGIKATIVVEYQIADAYIATTLVEDFETDLYVSAQLALRNIVTPLPFEEVMQQRTAFGAELTSLTAQAVAGIGLTVSRVEIKDIMLPGDLKRIYSQVAEAKQLGAAQLERARGESASLRSLANSARLLDEHPNLWKLRVLEAMENSKGNTFVIDTEMKPVQ